MSTSGVRTWWFVEQITTGCFMQSNASGAHRWLAVLVLSAAAYGQDSTSKNPAACTEGDAVSPWDDGASAGGSEQCNDYIVDLAPFQSAWGDSFAVGPLIKSSKASSGFSGSLISAQGLSSDYITGTAFAASTYDLWGAPGFGVNNSVIKNDPGTPVITADLKGDQFAAAFAEFGTTDAAASYNAIIGAVVNRLPAEPLRLYVHRVVAAANSCDTTSNLSQMGFGSIDASGNALWRADDFGASGGCGLNNLVEDNVLGADLAARNCDSRNVVSLEYLSGSGQSDSPAAAVYVANSTTTHNTPGVIPASVNGGNPAYIGTTFGASGQPGHYIHGQAGGVVSAGAAHLSPVVLDHRGNISYTTDNFFSGSTHGTAAILARVNSICDPGGSDQCNDSINVWGLGPNGAIAGTPRVLTLPGASTGMVTVFDACDGAINIVGKNEFGNYGGQVAFRGGNGQVAVGVDQQDRLLVAAMVNHPEDVATNWSLNYIAVARLDGPADGSIEWTMAAHNDGTTGEAGTGKAILDGPGGSVIGRLVTLDNVTGGSPFGPSMSSPMMDAVGNLYFLSAIELFHPGGGSDFNNGLIRAVYDPSTFCYELDLMLALGGAPNFGPQFYDPLAIHGQNSEQDWTINFLAIADSNSIDSGTAFSGNMTAVAHLGMNPSLIPSTRDPRAMGGMVLAAEIVYDSDEDGDEDDCNNPFDPPSNDEAYNVLLYIGADPPIEFLCPSGAVAECADVNNDGLRDDPLLSYQCLGGVCLSFPRGTGNGGQYGQADMGGMPQTGPGPCGNPCGANGCISDGVADNNDRFHALNCFSNVNFLGVPPYPCEPNAPFALIVDAGQGTIPGPVCSLDGVCDGNDAFHALRSFENMNFDGTVGYPCSYPFSPGPTAAIPSQESASLTLRAPRRVRPGALIDVEVYLDSSVKSLTGYQLHLGVSGGAKGSLDLVDMSFNEKREDYAYAEQATDWSAFNPAIAQMIVGMDALEGVGTRAGAYLATFTYRVSRDASGTFEVNVLHQGNGSLEKHRTFLFGYASGAIGVTSVTPAQITVADRSLRE
jgi:hypothetical protein